MKAVRIIITLAAIIMLLWFCAPIAFNVINLGNILGIVICACFIFRFGLNDCYKSFIKACKKTKIGNAFRIAANAVIVVFAVYAVVISSVILFFSSFEPPADSSATAIVLGAQVNSYGPSAALWQRIRAAEDYLNSHQNACAVVTGGKGANEPISEAESMYDNMTADGVDGSRIYKEDKATNTEQNILFSKKIISEQNLDESLAIVTDSYHQLRARLIARRNGIDDPIYAVNTQNNLTGLALYPTMFVREWIAIPAELLK